MHIPKSLFDRPTAAILKMRREAKLQKVKNLMVCGAAAAGVPLPPKGLAGLAPTVRPPMAQQGGFLAARPLLDLSPDTPEWLIHEDWAILQVRRWPGMGTAGLAWLGLALATCSSLRHRRRG